MPSHIVVDDFDILADNNENSANFTPGMSNDNENLRNSVDMTMNLNTMPGCFFFSDDTVIMAAHNGDD